MPPERKTSSDAHASPDYPIKAVPLFRKQSEEGAPCAREGSNALTTAPPPAHPL